MIDSGMIIGKFPVAKINTYKHMKALICKTAGEFVYQDMEMPEVPDGYTLLKIKRIGICDTDLHAYEGHPGRF